MHLYLTWSTLADKAVFLCYCHSSMPQTYFPDTYLRLDASSYHSDSFFKEEQQMAENLGMTYHHVHLSKRGLDCLPQFSPERRVCLVSNTHTPIEILPDSLLDQTAILLHPNSGYDNFTASWVENQSFPILVGNTIRSQAVAQYILTELLSHFNSVATHKAWDKTRKWNRELIDKQRVLIVGHGEIGQILEKSLRPICPEISIYDPFKIKEENLSLENLFPKADVILFACGLNESSKHLLNSTQFQKLQPHTLIINAARGPLIEEDALIHFLNQNPKAHAILDVFEKEPFGTQFENISNLKTTSHIAGVSQDLDQRIVGFAQDILSHFKENELSPKYDSIMLKNRRVNFEGKDILI